MNSGSKPQAKWRKRTTLTRPVSFRPLEDADIRFIWAAYKSGALADMAAFPDTSMDAPTFKRAFEQVVLDRVYSGWTMIAPTRKGQMPVGVIFAFYSHSEPRLSPFMIVGDLVWFPWASARNKIESAVNFFDIIRKSIPMMDYAHGKENRRFFDVLAKHAVVTRVGTTYNVVKGEPTAIYETRAP